MKKLKNKHIDPETVRNRCALLVSTCANLKPADKVLILSDSNTREIAQALGESASQVTGQVTHRVIPFFGMHGEEPQEDVRQEMLENTVIFGLTTMSLANTNARLSASQAGARYLSLPGYSWEVLASQALGADFRALTGLSNSIAFALSRGKEVSLVTDLGTNFSCSIFGRKGNAAPGWCWADGTLASPPDAEANISLIEDSANGLIVVDGSIPCPELGLLKCPIKMNIEKGRIVSLEGRQADILNNIFNRPNNPASRIIAEFGIGLNPLAELRGFMLEDEGCLGTVHIGAGSNIALGGKNNIPFHLDHVVRKATVFIDSVSIIRDGKILEENLR